MDSIINSENYIQFNKNIIDIEKKIDVCKLYRVKNIHKTNV